MSDLLTADRLLTVKDVAAFFNVSAFVVYDLITDGELAAHRIGGTLRIAPDDLRDYWERSKDLLRSPKKRGRPPKQVTQTSNAVKPGSFGKKINKSLHEEAMDSLRRRGLKF